MKGDKKKPTALRVLRMSANKAEKLMRQVSPTPGPLVDPPEWLSAEQKKEWKYVIENAPRDVLKKIDKSVVAGFVVAQDCYRQAVEAMRKTTLIVKSSKQEVPIQNPYLPIMNRQLLLMLRASSELGFTPCSRARIDAGNAPASHAGDWEEIS